MFITGHSRDLQLFTLVRKTPMIISVPKSSLVSLRISSCQTTGCGIAGKKTKVLTMELSLKAETWSFGTSVGRYRVWNISEYIRSSRHVWGVNQLSSQWS